MQVFRLLGVQFSMCFLLMYLYIIFINFVFVFFLYLFHQVFLEKIGLFGWECELFLSSPFWAGLGILLLLLEQSGYV